MVWGGWGVGGGAILKVKKEVESHFESILELFILNVIVNPCMIDF